MAATEIKKASLLENENMMMLMTMPMEEGVRDDAREYLRPRRREEVKKLMK